MRRVMKSKMKSSVPVGKLELFLVKHCDFRYNVVTGKVEYKTKDSPNFKELRDYDLNSIYRMCINSDVSITPSKLQAILISSFTPEFHPFWEYFKSLPEWDGRTDYIDQLARTVKTTNDTLWRKCFKKWLVAMTASVLTDSVINHTVIILSGTQGVGKSSWILKLLPPELKKYHFSGTINPGNKDTLIFLSECMIINLDELENLQRKELGSLKELITKNFIKLRRPYGRVSEDLPRRASFAASINSDQFLTDLTGSRRFLCFKALEIEYNHKVSLNNAYSQAKALVEEGFQYWFDLEEIEDLKRNNEAYRIMSVEEELLQATFEPCEISEASTMMTATKIFTVLQSKGTINLNNGSVARLGKVLRASGYQYKRQNGDTLYALKYKSHPESIDSNHRPLSSEGL